MQEPMTAPKPILKKPPVQPKTAAAPIPSDQAKLPAKTNPAKPPVQANPAKPPVQATPAKPPAQANPAKPPVHPNAPMQPVYRRAVFPHSLSEEKKQPKRKKFCRFLCCLLSIAVLILLCCITIAGGIVYLWFAPKLPVFKLRPVQFTHFGVKTGSDGASYLDSGVNIWMEVKNPNDKIKVYYDGSQATVSADVDVELGTATQTGFMQASGNVTVLRFVTHSGANQAVDLDTGKRLNSTVNTQEVKVNVEVKTKVGFGVGRFKVGMMPVDVACGGVSLKKLKDGGPAKCLIKWFSW